MVAEMAKQSDNDASLDEERIPLATETSFFEAMEALPTVQVLTDEQKEHFSIEGGDFSQILKVHLKPNEVITTEPYSMVLMDDGIAPKVDYGSVGQACTRACCAGENFFRLHLQNNVSENQNVCLSPVGPGTIIPIDLKRYSGIRFNSGAFLAAFGTDWRIRLQRSGRAAVMCCGGQGIFLNILEGSTTAFLTGVGTIEKLILKPDQKYIVDSENLLAFEQSVEFDVRSYGCSKVCCFGGFGLFQTVLTGPGLVLIQSLPMSKLLRSLGGYAAGSNNDNGGSD